ncbi:AAA family ATPase, partial [Escherichia coli]|nr:AAA family ATPase [Escherichia coli]
MTDEALSASLNTLSQLLAKHYGRKVVILIDEYDVPLDKAFQGGYYDEMVSLIRNLFGNALKTNDSLQFAVLTGCRRISKESIFTGLNNLNVMTVSDPYFCDSFGFTDDDVKELLDYYGLGAYHDAMRDWYDGYQFGNVSIYCPWDVIK